MFRRRRGTSSSAVHDAKGCRVADDLSLPLGGANIVTWDDCYYAWQLARIVAHLRELRRKRIARRRQAAPWPTAPVPPAGSSE